jgi:hypothetical protein
MCFRTYVECRHKQRRATSAGDKHILFIKYLGSITKARTWGEIGGPRVSKAQLDI